jgi:hypothetical protein
MSLVVASQLETACNERIAGHACRPTVIAAPESEPWSIAGKADVLIVRPTPAWRNAPHDHAPPGWPGRLRWIFNCSVGIDFLPWLVARRADGIVRARDGVGGYRRLCDCGDLRPRQGSGERCGACARRLAL